MKRKFKSMIIIFFDIKGNVHRELVLAGQAVSYVYYLVLRQLQENVRRLRPELSRQKSGCCITTYRLSLPFFTIELLKKKEHDCRPALALLLCFHD
jgi:hypothetical protein